MLGTVKNVNKQRGFGFLRGTDGIEYFFHRSGVARDVNFEGLREGDKVQFDEVESEKGPRADNVELA